MARFTKYPSALVFNLIALILFQKDEYWIKNKTEVRCPQEITLTHKEICRLKLKEQKPYCHATGSPKQAGIAMPFLDDTDFQAKLIKETKTVTTYC